MKNTLHILNKKSRLKTKLEHVPESPGVYLHKNAKNEIIYVGKAKNLKNRLKSYFNTQIGHSRKTHSLVEHIEDFDFIITKNEYESIIAENNFIKHYKPHYNILLKDSKTYPYLKIDKKEKWPQIVFTRRKKSDGALYFGPYANMGELDKILHVIHKFFPLVRCSKHTFKSIARPCNYYHIQQCLGPCHIKVDHAEYLEIVDRVIDLLRGKTRDIIIKIKSDMAVASKELNFEKAAKCRDSITALESIAEEQFVDLNVSFNADFICFLCSADYLVFYVSYVRNGVFVGANAYVNTLPENFTTSEEIFTSLILQFYDRHEAQENIFCMDESNLCTDEIRHNIVLFIADKHKIKSSIYTNQKAFFTDLKLKKDIQKKVRILMEMFLNNAKCKLEEKIKIDSSAAEKLLDVQKLLSLPRLPRWMECYDISTFQGAATVGSRVVFKDGLPHKSQYRKYIIKDLIGKMDDFGSLKEVLRRRFKDRNVDEIDLLLIDGGTPQVREIAYLFKSLGLENLFFAGIAKQRTTRAFQETQVLTSQERLVFPARDENHQLLPEQTPYVIELDPHTKAYQVLVSIRDEAHRFAINFHRKRRDDALFSGSRKTSRGQIK